MGIETLLFVVLFVIVLGIGVGIAKLRRRMANRIKPPIDDPPPRR